MKIFKNKWAKIGLIVFGIIVILLALAGWYGATHQTPETKVKIGLLRLNAKLSQITYSSRCITQDIMCFSERETIIQQFILSQDKNVSVPILSKNLSNKNKSLDLRIKILDILTSKYYLNIPQEEIYPQLLPIIKDKTDNPKIREGVLIALRGFRTEDLVDLEMQIAADTQENESVRSAAIANLGETKEKKAVNLLIGLLQDKNYYYVIDSSIYSLGNIGDKKAIPYILPFIESNDDWLRVGAETAIENIQK